MLVVHSAFVHHGFIQQFLCSSSVCVFFLFPSSLCRMQHRARACGIESVSEPAVTLMVHALQVSHAISSISLVVLIVVHGHVHRAHLHVAVSQGRVSEVMSIAIGSHNNKHSFT